MKPEEMMKYLLFGVGGYFLYQYAKGQGWLGGGGSATGPFDVRPDGTMPCPAGFVPFQTRPGDVLNRRPAQYECRPRTGETPPGSTGGPLPTTQVPQQELPQARILARAHAEMPSDWNGLLNVHQWNYYAAQVVGRPMPSPDEFGFAGEESSVPVTFETWWSRLTGSPVGRTAVGLAGIGWGRSVRWIEA